MSAFSGRLRLPGAFWGIEIRIRSNRSPSDRSFQFDVNSPPVSPGAISPPFMSGPWQLEHFSAYNFSPRLACSSVYTPSHCDFDPWARTVVGVSAACTPAHAARPTTATKTTLKLMWPLEKWTDRLLLILTHHQTGARA